MKLSGLDLVVQLAKAVCADDSLIKELEAWTVPVFPVKGKFLKDFVLLWGVLCISAE